MAYPELLIVLHKSDAIVGTYLNRYIYQNSYIMLGNLNRNCFVQYILKPTIYNKLKISKILILPVLRYTCDSQKELLLCVFIRSWDNVWDYLFS